MTTDQRENDDLFTARVSLGLRELDGVERAPDVAASVVRRLAAPAPQENRSRTSWLTVAAALLGIAVTATLLMDPDWGNSDDPANSPAQDPKGPWRLVYELPVDEMERSLGGNEISGYVQFGDSQVSRAVLGFVEQCVAGVANRVGSLGVVSRSGLTGFTIDIEDASAESVGKIRAMVEMLGRLEMRMIASGDYGEDGVQFDLARETKQMQEWLDAGGRERLLADSAAIDGYRAISKHLKWFVHRVRPWGDRPGSWRFRLSDSPAVAGVVVNSAADWNAGVIPAHIKARPVAERFLLEVVPVNMHQEHFSGSDIDHAATTVVEESDGGFGLVYTLRGPRAGEYADWSEEHIGECCAIIWDGELLGAPMFTSRIPGLGRISFGVDRDKAELVKSAMADQLPALPRLVKSEARDVKKPK